MKTIYYLPGNGGRLNAGLGAELQRRGASLEGREQVGAFRDLTFEEKISLIAEDLKTNHWHQDALVIANSMGAYLFLHAQSMLPAFVGKVVLLSPIIGEAFDPATNRNYVPPRAGKLQRLVEQGEFNAPSNCEVHVGEDDWQANPAEVLKLASRVGFEVNIVPGSGHQLDRVYVGEVLSRIMTTA